MRMMWVAPFVARWLVRKFGYRVLEGEEHLDEPVPEADVWQAEPTVLVAEVDQPEVR